MKGFVHTVHELKTIQKAPYYFDENYGFGPFLVGSNMATIALDDKIADNDYFFVTLDMWKEEQHPAVQRTIKEFEKYEDNLKKVEKRKKQVAEAKAKKEKAQKGTKKGSG